MPVVMGLGLTGVFLSARKSIHNRETTEIYPVFLACTVSLLMLGSGDKKGEAVEPSIIALRPSIFPARRTLLSVVYSLTCYDRSH